MAGPLPLHEAIGRAMDGRLNQAELARALGEAQPNVSRWMRGKYMPSLEDIRRIEDACQRPRGFILMAAGYVERGDSIQDAIERDPDLSDVGRAIVLAAYESARSHYRDTYKASDGQDR